MSLVTEPTFVVCPVCNSAATHGVAPYRGSHRIFSGMQRRACDACGMVFASPMPTDGALAEYNAQYFNNAHGGVALDPLTLAFHSAINRLRVSHVEKYVRERQIRIERVLEIGPGGGHFARHWLARNPGTSYHAIESDATCHPQLHTLGVSLHASPHEVPLKPGMDLVVLSHVLEHMVAPAKFLGELSALLSPGGALFIEVPCQDWQHKAEDEPHLLFFDMAPMQVLLEQLGYSQLRLSYHGREIAALRAETKIGRKLSAVRTRLLRNGMVAPFDRVDEGLEEIEYPLERAAVRPFKAHVEQHSPAWWLRAVATKL